MSSNTMMTLLMNGIKDKEGICSFERKIMFSSSYDWVANSLGQTPFKNVKLLTDICKQDLETQTRAFDFLENQDFDCESIFVIACAMPELTKKHFEKLFKIHNSMGQDITVLTTLSSFNAENVINRDEDDVVRFIGCGFGEIAYPAVIFRKDIFKQNCKNAKDIFDVVNIAAKNGAFIEICQIDNDITVLTDGIKAYEAQKKLVMKINMDFISKGVQIFSAENTFISPDAQISAGVVILPNSIIKQGCKIGKDAVIGPNSMLYKAQVGCRTTINNSQFMESIIGDDATVGPFAYVRPNCRIGDKTRIGDFVELKNAQIGDKTKVSHLTYVGDAQIGERVNFGCGTVIVNYDGYNKFKTEIGNDCFIGCNTNIIAPIKIGDRVFTAAGTTVTKDVPDGALTVARSKQTNIEGWNDRRREKMSKER